MIESLEHASHLPGKRQVAPHHVSVQTLADLANAVETEIDTAGTSRWIGCPLRVHRRCVDPMFTIANEIAYQGKMIFFDPGNPESRLPPPDTLDLGRVRGLILGERRRTSMSFRNRSTWSAGPPGNFTGAQISYRPSISFRRLSMSRMLCSAGFQKLKPGPRRIIPRPASFANGARSESAQSTPFRARRKAWSGWCWGAMIEHAARQSGPPASPICSMSHSREPGIASS